MKLLKNNILAVSMILLTSCGTAYQQSAPEFGPNTSINDVIVQDQELVDIIQPYKEELKKKMDRVVTYSPIDLNKDGFNAPLCNLVADVTLEYINDVYQKEGKGKVDVALFNYYGLRRTFSSGDLTVGNFYELMPFDNEIYILDVKGETIVKMVEYILNSKTGHPVSNITATSLTDIKIDGKPLDLKKNYKVATTDYLYNGGDNMFFLQDAFEKDIPNLKHRDLLLDYFEKVDTVIVNTNARITK